MSNNYLLKYKTFAELMAEIRGDFKTYEANGMIDDAEYIKIAQYINRKLGNKLRQDKEQILYVEKGRVRLPADFHKLNAALICYEHTITSKVLRGDNREYREVDTVVPVPGCEDSCEPINPCVRLTECGTEYEIIETTAYETRKYNQFGKLNISNNASVMPGCFNLQVQSEYNGYIKGNFLYTNFDEGKVYISYLGQMEDEDGNLIVLDHDLINPYYEYAIKQRLLENLYIAGEDVSQKIGLIDARLKVAKVEAESLINMPDSAEMDMFHKINREANYRKYYYIFK